VGKKPDIDNLEKFLFDSLEGVIFDDDKHIVQIKEASKFYDSAGECKGSTIVKIVSINDLQSRKANGMNKKEYAATRDVVLDE
jgi:Holliday junction resolvase